MLKLFHLISHPLKLAFCNLYLIFSFTIFLIKYSKILLKTKNQEDHKGRGKGHAHPSLPRPTCGISLGILLFHEIRKVKTETINKNKL